MIYAGIDIGSTAAKAVILDGSKQNIIAKKLMPTGWNSKETANELLTWLDSQNIPRSESRIIATGYGRVSVPYADKTLTEITCHAKGAAFLAQESGNLTVIDIGGQDTKIILLSNGRVVDFVMNDKCSAGTGKFLEVMSNRMGLTLPEFFSLAEHGQEVKISSMCTVFAESEIVSLMGLGTPRENIACGAISSVAAKVAILAGRKTNGEKKYFLTGGFCEAALLVKKLAEVLNAEVKTCPDSRFAGAIGAALLG